MVIVVAGYTPNHKAIHISMQVTLCSCRIIRPEKSQEYYEALFHYQPLPLCASVPLSSTLALLFVLNYCPSMLTSIMLLQFLCLRSHANTPSCIFIPIPLLGRWGKIQCGVPPPPFQCPIFTATNHQQPPPIWSF